jgi:hypothetical protein
VEEQERTEGSQFGRLTPAERTIRSRIAASDRWARTDDRAAATASARGGLHARFEREVDPEGVLGPDELARRVASAKTAYYSRLALKSAQARRARGRAAQLEAEVEHALSDPNEKLPPPQTWSLPPEPGPEVTRVSGVHPRLGDGVATRQGGSSDYHWGLEIAGHTLAPMSWGQLLVYFGTALSDATQETTHG